MNCPACASEKHRVLQTRRDSPESIIRQRICRQCGHTWFSLEVDMPDGAIAWSHSSLIRNDGYKHITFH
jgi:transcriptional regulator NrdR family protein